MVNGGQKVVALVKKVSKGKERRSEGPAFRKRRVVNSLPRTIGGHQPQIT